MTVYNRNNYILTDSPLKRDLLKLFKKYDKLTILDIGGCEGEESIRYSRIFPFSSIYIFEPLPENQKLIAENLEKYKAENVTMMPVAVSDEDGMSTFNVSSGHPDHEPNELDWDFGNKSSSLLSPEKENNQNWLSFDKQINVSTITLQSFLAENKIDEIDFIHMDVQGAELKVLMGAKDSIKKIKAIWLEVADIELYKDQPLRVDIENFMKANGFYLVKSEIEGQVGDQFYLNKNYFEIFLIFSYLVEFHMKKICNYVFYIAKFARTKLK
jgi:FkbM family methyltransferase